MDPASKATSTSRLSLSIYKKKLYPLHTKFPEFWGSEKAASGTVEMTDKGHTTPIWYWNYLYSNCGYGIYTNERIAAYYTDTHTHLELRLEIKVDEFYHCQNFSYGIT